MVKYSRMHKIVLHYLIYHSPSEVGHVLKKRKKEFKGTESAILSNSPLKDDNARFTTAPLKL